MPGSTPVLTETVIDIADRHTSLYYLRSGSAGGPLPFYDEAAYCGLHEEVVKGISYQSLANQPPSLLSRLQRGYSNNKYWLRYVGAAEQDFAKQAWKRLLPLDASTLTRRIEYIPCSRFSFRVCPKPFVRLYPFGWSTCISLRILGNHSISDLAEFLVHLFEDGALQYEDSKGALSISQLFNDFAEGVRKDAFDNEADDHFTQDIAVVATVMAKHGGSPSAGALGPDEQAKLRRIARPYGPPPTGSFSGQVHYLPPGDSKVDYLVYEKYGRFLWVEHMLHPVKKEYVDLRCYHNNSFVSLIHAWHLHALVDAVTEERTRYSVALAAAKSAANLLKAPNYKSASLMRYLDRKDVKESIDTFFQFVAGREPKKAIAKEEDTKSENDKKSSKKNKNRKSKK